MTLSKQARAKIRRHLQLLVMSNKLLFLPACPVQEIAIYALDMITIAVPPALVVCLALTTTCMLLRMRRLKISVKVGLHACIGHLMSSSPVGLLGV